MTSPALTRRMLTAGLSAAALAPTDAFAAPRNRADAAFDKLASAWLERSLRLSPANATQIGDHRFDARIDDLSAAGRAKSLALAQSTLSALGAIDRTALSRANQVDAALLANELQSQIWRTQTRRDWA